MKRSIQFWYFGNTDGTALAGQFPYSALQRKISAAQSAGADLEVTCDDGAKVTLSLIEPEGGAPFFVLYRPRHENSSHMNDRGSMRPLPLTAGQHQAEATYIKFLSSNVVGFLLHADGPRPRRLAEFLAKRFNTHHSLLPIYRTDLDATIREMTVQHLEIAIPSAQAAQLTQASGLEFAQGLSAFSQLVEDGSITLRLSVGRGGTSTKRSQKRGKLAELAARIFDLPANAGFSRASLVGQRNNDSLNLDLLDRKFAYRVPTEADEFIAGQTEVRDDTARIDHAWQADRPALEALVPALPHPDETEGLLGELRGPGE